jgi:cytochrome c peroxidase
MTKYHVTLCDALGALLIACVSFGAATTVLAGDTTPNKPAAAPRASTQQAVAEVPNAAPASTPEAEKQRQERPAGGPLHGAQAMDAQLAQISRWLPQVTNKNAPAGVDPSYWQSLIPADNQITAERVALGRKLYFDNRLSKDGTVACATCHDVSRGFSDRRARAEGIRDQIGQRNSPVTLNAAFFSSQFWDGRAATLEDQAKLPIVNPIEMGQPDGATAAKAIANDAEYQAAFKAAYNRPVNYDDVARAIATFERTLIFLDAPFDRFARGDRKAISADAAAGWALFNGKARCVSCHQISSNSPIGTDNRFHNIGVSARHQDFEKLATTALAALAKDSSKESLDQLALQTNLSELGRFVVSRNRSEIGAFKTSQLRNVGVTGPYMHDGTLSTLWDVMDHYNKGGEANAYLDGGIEPLALTEREVRQVVEFMFTLTDVRLDEQNRAEHTRQQQLAAAQRPFRDDVTANRKQLQFEARAEGRAAALANGKR